MEALNVWQTKEEEVKEQDAAKESMSREDYCDELVRLLQEHEKSNNSSGDKRGVQFASALEALKGTSFTAGEVLTMWTLLEDTADNASNISFSKPRPMGYTGTYLDYAEFVTKYIFYARKQLKTADLLKQKEESKKNEDTSLALSFTKGMSSIETHPLPIYIKVRRMLQSLPLPSLCCDIMLSVMAYPLSYEDNSFEDSGDISAATFLHRYSSILKVNLPFLLFIKLLDINLYLIK